MGMDCVDWPGLGHMPALGQDSGAAPPKSAVLRVEETSVVESCPAKLCSNNSNPELLTAAQVYSAQASVGRGSRASGRGHPHV